MNTFHNQKDTIKHDFQFSLKINAIILFEGFVFLNNLPGKYLSFLLKSMAESMGFRIRNINHQLESLPSPGPARQLWTFYK